MLSEVLPYGPLVADHCALAAGLDPTLRPQAAPLSADEQRALLGGVRGWERWLDECDQKAPEGYIYVKGEPGAAAAESEWQGWGAGWEAGCAVVKGSQWRRTSTGCSLSPERINCSSH